MNRTTILTRNIIVRLQFEGFHCWPEAPPSCEYLRNRHRHIFHVEAVKNVSHNEREIEFILLKRKIQHYIQTHMYMYAGATTTSTKSCETIAEELVRKFGLQSCRVFEDNENGAEVVAHEVHLMRQTEQPTPTQASVPVAPDTRQFNGGLFVGDEAEGPTAIRGIRTLFIPGSYRTDFNSLAGTLAQFIHFGPKKMTRHIYLGAYNDFNFEVETIEHIIKICDHALNIPNRLIIEVNSLEGQDEDTLEAFHKLVNTFRKKYALSPKLPTAGRCVLVNRSIDEILSQKFYGIKFDNVYWKVTNKMGIYWVETKPTFTSKNDVRFTRDVPVEQYLLAGGELTSPAEEEEEDDNE